MEQNNTARKSVLITAGADSVGAAIARKFASEGWDTYITSRSAEKAAKAASNLAAEYHIQSAGFGLDMLSEESVDQLFSSLTDLGVSLDSIVLNAVSVGRVKVSDPLTCNISDWAEPIQTNIVGNFMLARNAARMMVHKGGTIVFMSSNTSHTAIFNRSQYIASKGGINALMRALAVDLGKYAIRVNALLAGVILNERIAGYSDTVKEVICSRSPLSGGAWSMPDETATAVYFLASDQSSNITGAELVMDGGASILLGADASPQANRKKEEEKEHKLK